MNRLARLRRTDIRPWRVLTLGFASAAESRCHPRSVCNAFSVMTFIRATDPEWVLRGAQDQP